MRISEKIDEICKNVPNNFTTAQYSRLASTIAKNEFKTSLLLCDTFFEDELGDERIQTSFKDRILYLTNVKGNIYAENFPIEDN